MLYLNALNEFQTRARARKVCFGMHISTMSAQVVEMAGLVGLDFVIISREVEGLDEGPTEHLLRAANAAGTIPMVKLRRNDPNLVEEALNAGAPMLNVPHVRTRKELDAIIRSSRFAPKGTRGLCPAARYNGFGAGTLDNSRTVANEQSSIIPILEDKECLDNLDDLMSSPDVDIFEIGPFDLSHSLGLNPALSYGNPGTMAAVEAICEAARKHNKVVMAPSWFPKEAVAAPEMIDKQVNELVSRGITVLYHLVDIMLLARSLREMMPIRDRGK
jgi:4-hydroxy-2-oxoheptanedioate aldolase